MSSLFSRAPSRSYEPLAVRICKALHAILNDSGSQWVPVSQVSEFIKVRDEELLNGAITLAAQKGWLMVGGQPVHSLFLTDTGEAMTLRKSGHTNAPVPKSGRATRKK